jgi:flavin-dependent dehydrogenase
MVDHLVVGAGFAGAVLAERLASGGKVSGRRAGRGLLGQGLVDQPFPVSSA